MANRYQDDLRYIIGIDDLRGGISPPTNKSKILGGTGVANIDSNSLSETPIPAPSTPDEPSTNFDGMKKGGTYTGIGDLVDCETGDCVSVRYDGQFSAPEGWDNPDLGPVPDDYEPGFFFRSSFSESFNFYDSTPSALAIQYETFHNNISTFTLVFKGITVLSEFSYRAYYDSYFPNGDLSGEVDYNITKVSCGSSSESYCTSPAETEWPVDKCTEVSFNVETGKFETHLADTNVPANLSGGINNVPELCDPITGDHIKHLLQSDGTIAIVNIDQGISKFIDNTGVVVNIGMAEEAYAGQP